MKYLASVILSSVLSLFVPSVAMAQLDEFKNSTPEQRAQLQTQWMKSNLSLDATAVTTVADINLKYAKETQSLMDSEGPKIQKLMTFRQQSTAKDSEMKTLFTPEQYTLYQQKKTEMEATIKQEIMKKYQAAQ